MFGEQRPEICRLQGVEFRSSSRAVTLRSRREIGGPDVGLTQQHSASDRERLEATAEAVLPFQILDVRARTRAALREIAGRITPGMSEDAGRTIAATVLRDAGLRKGWHKILVRFGPNTTKNFEDPSTPGVALGDDDIFFIDIGPIYEGCEGDAGDTFAVGDDLEMTKAAEDVKSIWDRDAADAGWTTV